jgi:hypothetical protein
MSYLKKKKQKKETSPPMLLSIFHMIQKRDDQLAAPCFSPPFGNIHTSFSITNYTLSRLLCRLRSTKRGLHVHSE